MPADKAEEACVCVFEYVCVWICAWKSSSVAFFQHLSAQGANVGFSGKVIRVRPRQIEET